MKDLSHSYLAFIRVCLFTDPFSVKMRQRSTKKYPEDLLTAKYNLFCVHYGTEAIIIITLNYLCQYGNSAPADQLTQQAQSHQAAVTALSLVTLLVHLLVKVTHSRLRESRTGRPNSSNGHWEGQ